MIRFVTAVAMLSLAATTFATAAEEHHGAPAGHPAARPAARPMARPAPHAGAPHAAAGRPAAAAAAGRPGPRPGFAGRPGAGPHGGALSWRGHNINRVHASPFAYPHGYGYRRWAVGATLPGLFLTPDYYYTDWAGLGLTPPDPGFQWVRYGPDLLLVNVSTGQVVDVLYGVFY
jgi:Ni/Co efflux regulator RcnB